MEIIDKIDGEEPPQLMIVDESVSSVLVEEIRDRGKRNNGGKIRNGVIAIHVGYNGFKKGMTDFEIVELGKSLGHPFILTHDTDFYKFKEDYEKKAEGYGKIVVLKQMDSISNYLKKIQKAGIEVRGNGIRKIRSFS